ncbi:MAG TPA: hypothetical protein VKR06_31580 [Ktedonosporobacter sp.]|nr:hypothetical protein [Ktedonosporobacter sp.]
MEAEEILAQVRGSKEAPEGWIVFPLLRNKVIWGLAGWLFGIIVGLGLFAAVASVVIPGNFQHGVLSALVTLLFLAMFLFIGLGSIYLFFVDIMRLRNADQHLIVITSDDFVKQEGAKIISVPLAEVRHVTARGLPPPDRTPPSESELSTRAIPGIGENVTGFFLGRGTVPSGANWKKKRRRTPTSLAFIDRRTDKEVVVLNDNCYGDPFLIAAYLKQYAASVQEIRL